MTRQPPNPRAYTLVEVVVTLAIMSTVVLGLGSAIMLSARAAPSANDALGLASDASGAVEAMTDELAAAVLFKAITPTRVRFCIADRDNDTNAETIEYAWSGTKGDPLTRALNGQSTTVLIDRIDSLVWTTSRRSASLFGDAYTRLDEEAFWSNTSPSSYAVEATDTTWLGQAFSPSTKSGALGWVATSVDMDLSGKGDALYAVEIRSFSSGVVGTTVYASATIDLSQLGSLDTKAGFEHIPLGNQSLIEPGTGVCVLLYRVWGSSSMLWGQKLALPKGGGRMLYSSNSGGSWSTSSFSYRSMVVRGQQVFAGDNGEPTETIEAVFIDLTMTGQTTPMRVGVRLPGGASAP